MSLDTFRIRRGAAKLLLGAIQSVGARDEDDYVDGLYPPITLREVLLASGKWPDEQHRAYSAATAVEWLVYALAALVRDDERPIGFVAKSLLGRTVAVGEVNGVPELWLWVHFAVWQGPVEISDDVVYGNPDFASGDAHGAFWDLIVEIERLANVAVPMVRALERQGLPGDHPVQPNSWSAPVRAVGPGQEFSSIWGWFAAAPPKGRDRQWKDKRSAKELAKAWTHKDSVSIPDGLRRLLDSRPETSGLTLWDILPEHKTPLDAFGGETRNHDLIGIGRAGGGQTLLAVEAKATEPLGPLVEDQLTVAQGKPNSKIPQRVDMLSLALFGIRVSDHVDDDIAAWEIGHLRYQLLTASCGAVIEAGRRGCGQAVLIIHEFVADPLSDGHTDAAAALRQFLSKLGADDEDRNELAGPFSLHRDGVGFIPPGIRLYIGRVITALAQPS